MRGILGESSRFASNIWFVLIGLSAVLTYQHHVMDVVAGFALGAYCLYSFPDGTADVGASASSNRRVGSYYLAGTFACIAMVLLFWPWAALLLWPAISLGLAAIAYFGAGPAIYRKAGGRVPWSTQWALAPVLLGQELFASLLSPAMSGMGPIESARVRIGSALSGREADVLVKSGVTAVLDLTAQFTAPRCFRALHYRNIHVLDLTAPSVEQFEEAAAFIERESTNGIVYVHCKIGIATAAVAVAYLLWAGKANTVTEGIDCVRRARPTVIIRPEVIRALDDFATSVSPRFEAARVQ